MAQVRSIAAGVIAPLMMAALIFVPHYSAYYNAPPLRILIIFSVFFSYIFFWLCVLITGLIKTRLGVANPLPSVLISAGVAFLMSGVGSIVTRTHFHEFRWSLLLRDGLELTVAFVASYIVYRAFRRSGTLLLEKNVPNNRVWTPPSSRRSSRS
jgi:hypothetical protein